MNNIKTKFSIKDLENISGVKAHTIRIWEKRYDLLTPSRTKGNSRFYDQENLQKLLNVILLNNNNYKISKIAALTNDEIVLKAREIALLNNVDDDAINSLKIAMYNFDQNLFNKVYAELLTKKTFQEIFKDTFVPLLNFIGLLWQTKSLTPAHEHFISNLISQKIQVNTERINFKPTSNKKVYVLYLPENEIHELGLLYLNYELKLRGLHSVYLGQSVPLKNLKDLQNVFNSICFISYFIVEPSEDKIVPYYTEFSKIMKNSGNELWVIGKKALGTNPKNAFKNIKIFSQTTDVLEKL
ncbi:MerR family transcriptional regulator [uncultured Maribacter sp.]|uniref:MerR family transcriptional regulator n=1 Tax=uncultured Maribacter sp. TaxID=431308 RepID=UPI00262679F3|nr:MerR family transcriptional regulator [uncultured Maribacter sp.]